jgi:FkbM family methyltransferase
MPRETSFLERFDLEHAPRLGVRGRTFRRVFEELEARRRDFYTVVETGVAHLAGPDGDPAHQAVHGHSTLLFDQFVQVHGGVVYSVDLSPAHCARARGWVSDRVRLQCHDSRLFLAGFVPPTPIDCVYLDSADLDWSDPHPSALHCMDELCAILGRLGEGCIVFVDDMVDGAGKAGYIAEVMERIGARLLFDDYQVGWQLAAPAPAVRPWGRYDADELAFVLARSRPRRYRYVRAGLDERILELLPDGLIGHGRAAYEERWFAERGADGRIGLVLSGRGRTVARLAPGAEPDHWRGRWLVHDRCAIELVPLPAESEAPREARCVLRAGPRVRVLDLLASHDVGWGRGSDGETWRIEGDALVLSAAGRETYRLRRAAEARWQDGGAELERLDEVTAAERAARGALVAQRYFRYRSAGCGEWPLELFADGALRHGDRAGDASWDVEEDAAGEVSLVLRAGSGLATRLVPTGDGAFAGRRPTGGRTPVRVEPFQQGSGAYLLPVFTACLARDRIRRVVEVGSGDGSDAVRMQRYFDADVLSFECNPEVLPICAARFAGEPRIELFPAAVGDRDGTITFHRVVNGNRHASSCFRANPSYPYERLLQESCEVEMVRLDRVLAARGIDAIDLLAIDVQGACLEVLRGLGERLDRVRYIIAELETRPVYEGEALAPEVIDFLAGHGFHLLRSMNQWGVTPAGYLIDSPGYQPQFAGAESWFGDYLFVRHTPREAEVARDLVARGRFRYARLGFDERPLTFLPGGQLGEGSAPCEQSWIVEDRPDGTVELALVGVDQVTCRLTAGSDGRWRGRWIAYERMPILLEPL